MNTRALIAAINDAGLFERLASSILRMTDPQLSGVIETGTNSRGQTIADPVDGIVISAREDGSLVATAVHHTITDRVNLRSKWLDSSEGDVAKAISLLNKAESNLDVFERRLVLTSTVDPPSSLVPDVIAAGAKEGVRIDIWSGSRIAHFLDVDRDGQWLRRKLLGVPQERLSLDLLRTITAKMLQDARPIGDPAEHVAREVQQQIADRTQQNDSPLFIQGRSGSGKSVLCFDWAAQVEAQGNVCIVLNERILDAAASFENALAKQMKAYAPDMIEGADLHGLSDVLGSRDLWVWIEDINRAPAPTDLIRKLLRWQRSYAAQRIVNAVKGLPSIRIACPIWPELLQMLTKDEREAVEGYSLYIPDYDAAEATAAVRRRAANQMVTLTDLEAYDVAESLGRDPLLIGLSSNWQKIDAATVIQQYLDDTIAALAKPNRFRKSELETVIVQVGKLILARGDLSPRFQDCLAVADTPAQEAAFRAIIDDGRIIRFDGNDRLHFRHDRVRDHILAMCLATLEDDDLTAINIIKDPFWSRVIGQTYSTSENVGRVRHLLDELSPLAIFTTFSFAVRSQLDSRQVLFEITREYLQSEAFRLASRQEIYAIQAELSQLDGEDVCWLLSKIDEHSWMQIEGLARNGHVRSAASFCYSHDPYMISPRRDRLIDHLKKKRDRGWIREVSEFLLTFDGSEKLELGLLFLIGELGNPELLPPLKSWWRTKSQQGRKLCSGVLMAALRSAVPDDTAFVDEILRAWSNLPEEDEASEHSSPRFDVGRYALAGIARRDPSDDLIDCLVAAASRYPNLRNPIASILVAADHPAAVTYVVRFVAEIDRRCEKTNRHNLWGSRIAEDWGGGSRTREYRRMSKHSKRAMEDIWNNADEDIWDRRRAFDIWSARLDLADCAALADNPPAGLEDRALSARAMNSDRTAKGALATKIVNDIADCTYWLQFARFIGTDGLENTIREIFEFRRQHLAVSENSFFSADYLLAELLSDRDDGFAYEVLYENWDQLENSNSFVVAMLYLATPMSIELATQSIRSADDPSKIFEHLTMRFGVKTFRRPGITRVEQLEAVLPYFPLLDDLCRWDIWEQCNAKGWFDWRRKHLDSQMTFTGGRHIQVDEVDDFDALDNEFAKAEHSRSDAHFWCRFRIEAGFSIDQLISRAANYAMSRKTSESFAFLCDVVSEHGQRTHLEVLSQDWALQEAKNVEHKLSAEFSVKNRTII